jgi:putative ABC transport system ATP-binding protein
VSAPSFSQSSAFAILDVQNLTRVVDGRPLVNEVSFRVQAGEVFGITGPSGSGKSSLLRLLNRLDEPTAGTVFLDGTDYRNIPPRDLRRRIGMVTQRPYLFPGSVAQNVSLGPRQRGNELSSEAVEALLSRVGLTGYGTRNVANLSGGEAQRVSLARALANSPQVLLLDEPTSALDDEAKLGIESLIQQVVADVGLTCVVVTHDIAQSARLAARLMILEAGRAVRISSVQEMRHA